MNPLLPESLQQDVVFLLEQRVFSEDLLFDRNAWEKIRIKVPKKVIMSTLKVGCAFQSKISALQTSDGISLPPYEVTFPAWHPGSRVPRRRQRRRAR